MEPDFDPGAPYGRKPDGTPYKVPLERRIELGQRLAEGRAQKAARAPGLGWGPPPVARAGSKATPKVSQNITTVMGLAAIPMFLFGAAARFNPTFALDSMTVRMHAPNIAAAVDMAAQESDRIQAYLDAAGKATPGVAILAAAVPMFLQFGANHGFMQAIPEMGVYDAETLLRMGGFDVPEQAGAPAAESAGGSADVPAF